MAHAAPVESTPLPRAPREGGWQLAFTSLIPPHVSLWPRSTRFWVLMLVGISLLLITGMTLVAQRGLVEIRAHEAQVGGIRVPVLQEAYHLKIANERTFVGLRGFVITGDETLLKPWYDGQQVFHHSLQALRELDTDPATRMVLADLERRHLAFSSFGARMIEVRRAGAKPESLTQLIQEGNQFKLVLDARLDALIAQQDRALVEAGHQMAAQERGIEQKLAILYSVAVLMTLVLAVLVIWRVMFPLRALEEASLAVGKGRLGARVPSLKNVEFDTVATAFNQMADQVERSIQELQSANTQLRENDRYKDQFLAVISHELRTPLNLILGFGGMLQAELQGPLTPQQRDCMERMMKGGKQMLALINDLLDMSQLAAGKLQLSPTTVIYPALVDQAIGIIHPLANEKQLEITVDLAADAPVWMDSMRMVKVLTSLLSNAVKFTARGGQIGIKAFVRDGELVTEVSDTGCGIAEADRPRLFEHFFQLDMSTTRRAGGAGLGLAIAKGLVQAHGGSIGVESEVGKGSVFWFSVPLRTPGA